MKDGDVLGNPLVLDRALAIDPHVWDLCASNEEQPQGKTAFSVIFSPDGSEVVLAGAVVPLDGGKARISLITIEPAGNGLAWLAAWLNGRYKTASCVVIDGASGADTLTDMIRTVWRFKDSVIRPTANETAAAAEMLLNELNSLNVTWHSTQDELRESAITAIKRPTGAGWMFGGMESAPIVACSLALWGCKTAKRNPTRKMLIG